MKNFFKYFVLITIFSSILPISNGLQSEVDFKVKTTLQQIDKFGFDAGGSFSFLFGYNSQEVPSYASTINLYVCTDSQFTNLINYDPSLSAMLCNYRRCSFTYNLTDPRLSHEIINARDLYHFLIISCDQAEHRISIDYEFLNLNGQNLSVGQEQLPSLYFFLTIFWGVLLLCWFFFFIFFQKFCGGVHLLVFSVCALKFSVVTVAFSYWKICSIQGNCLIALTYTESFLFSVSEACFFCTLLLIAKGWKITRNQLPPGEIRTILAAMVLLLATLIFFSFYNDGYYFISLMIMYFFMIPKIFTSIGRNCRILRTQLMFSPHRSNTLNSLIVSKKIQLFKHLRTGIAIYLGAILVVNSIRIVMVWYLDWVNYLLNEVVVLIMLNFISFLLSPQRKLIWTPIPEFDSSLFDILPDLFSESDVALLQQYQTYSPDPKDIIIIEYPSDERSRVIILNDLDAREIVPTSVPLAMGVLEQSIPNSEIEKQGKDTQEAEQQNENDNVHLIERREGSN